MDDLESFESKPTITFDEFKAWLSGLVVGKGGAVPDINDWKKIKKMMDKVVEAEPYQPIFPQIPLIPGRPENPFTHPIFPYDDSGTPFNPWIEPTTTPVLPNQDWTITCGDTLVWANPDNVKTTTTFDIDASNELQLNEK